MISLLLLAGCPFVVSLLATPLVRALAVRRGLVDAPDKVRKDHAVPIPRVGGVAIAAAYFVSLAIFLLMRDPDGAILRRCLPRLVVVGPALIIVFLIGLWDDLTGLRAYQKLLGQIVAASYVVLGGLTIGNVGSHVLTPWIAVPLSILWLIGCTNAVNLIDGLDGLAGSVGFFASLTVFIAAVIRSDVGLAFAALPLAGALLGFLRYNFSPASIFMGDSGSLFIGFLLGCFSLMWGEKSATLVGLTAPLIVLAFPLTDTALAIIRRGLRRMPVFGADRGHIHHRLLERGLSPRQITDLMCVLTVFLSSLAILTSMAEHLAVCIVVIVLTGLFVAIHQLRYVEFEAVRRVVGRLFWQHVTAEMHVIQLEQALEKAGSLRSCVESINAACEPFGVCADLYAAKDSPVLWDEQLRSGQWELHIPVSGALSACLRSDANTGGEMRLPARLVDTAVIAIRRHCAALPGWGNVVRDADNSCCH